MPDDDALKIGEVAERTELSRDTLRYWEERGLIPEPPRFDSSGYRAYPPETVRRARAVKRAQELGFELEEIRQLLEGRDRGETCEERARMTEERIREFREEIEALQSKIDGLRSLGDARPGDLPAMDRPVVDLLADS